MPEFAAAVRTGRAVPGSTSCCSGMAPEGHVASIFPDSAAVSDERPVVAVRELPQTAATRVSLGLPGHQRGRGGGLLVAGEAKAAAVAGGRRARTRAAAGRRRARPPGHQVVARPAAASGCPHRR